MVLPICSIWKLTNSLHLTGVFGRLGVGGVKVLQRLWEWVGVAAEQLCIPITPRREGPWTLLKRQNMKCTEWTPASCSVFRVHKVGCKKWRCLEVGQSHARVGSIARREINRNPFVMLTMQAYSHSSCCLLVPLICPTLIVTVGPGLLDLFNILMVAFDERCVMWCPHLELSQPQTSSAQKPCKQSKARENLGRVFHS